MRKSTALVLQILLVIGFIGFCVAFLLWIQYRWFHPKPLKRVHVPELHKPVSLVLDSSGTGHIYAESENDLIIALGYYAASQRLWEMELMKRAAQGRLSEVFGTATLEFDFYFRNLLLDTLAERLYQNASPASREWCRRYAQGVNRYIIANRKRLPVEFRLVQLQPRRWEPRDCFLIQRFVSWLVDASWKEWALIRQLHDTLPQQLQKELVRIVRPTFLSPLHPEIAPVPKKWWDIDRKFRQWWWGTAYAPRGFAFVSPDTSRNPPPLSMLFLEPLGAPLPFRWLPVHLSGPTIEIAGLTVPGIPGIIVGGNRQIAWGTIHIPSQSTFFQKMPAVESQTKSSVPFSMERVQQNIRVGNAVRSRTFFITPRGPTVNLDGGKPDANDTLSVLAWQGWQMSDEIAALRKLFQAQNWEEFQEALNTFQCPSSAFVYGDVSGKWGVVKIGSGEAVQHKSSSYSTAEQQAIRETGSFFYPIRNRVLSSKQGSFLIFHPGELDFAPGLEASFSEKSPNYMVKLPSDTSTNLSRVLIQDYTAVHRLSQWLGMIDHQDFEEKYPAFRDIFWILSHWDGSFADDQVAATIYSVWEWYWVEQIFRHWMGDEVVQQLAEVPGMGRHLALRIWESGNSEWFDDPDSTHNASRRHILNASLRRTLDFLYSRLGEIHRWDWKTFCSDLLEQSEFPEKVYSDIRPLIPVGLWESLRKGKSSDISTPVDWDSIRRHHLFLAMRWPPDSSAQSNFSNSMLSIVGWSFPYQYSLNKDIWYKIPLSTKALWGNSLLNIELHPK